MEPVVSCFLLLLSNLISVPFFAAYYMYFVIQVFTLVRGLKSPRVVEQGNVRRHHKSIRPKYRNELAAVNFTQSSFPC